MLRKDRQHNFLEYLSNTIRTNTKEGFFITRTISNHNLIDKHLAKRTTQALIELRVYSILSHKTESKDYSHD
jgi:hypothetical protein